MALGLITFSLGVMLLQSPAGLQKASIQGTVTRAGTGQPLSGARIVLVKKDSGGIETSVTSTPATTDNSGKYLITGIDAGDYSFSVQREGFITQAGRVIAVVAGQRLTVDFQMGRAGVIAGRVLDDHGEPLAGATVQAQSYQYVNGRRSLVPVAQFSLTGAFSPPAQATTNDLGEYRLFWIPPGEYVISVRARAQLAPSPIVEIGAPPKERPFLGGFTAHEQPEPFSPVYYPGVSNPEAATTVKMAAGAEVRGIDFTWRPLRLPAIRGQVTVAAAPVPESNNPRQVRGQEASGMIVLTPVGGGRVPVSSQMGRSQFGPSGNFELFEIRGVPAGSYFINANLRRNGMGYFGRTRVEVADADVNDIGFVARPTVRVQGRVIVDSPSPQAFALSKLSVGIEATGTEMGLSTWNTVVTESGTFTLQNVAPVEYRLTVTGLPAGGYIHSATIGSADVMSGPFVLDDPSEILDVRVAFSSGGVSGTVRDASGTIRPASLVTLIPDEPRRTRKDLYFTASSNSNGRFAFTNVPDGNYRIFAWERIPPGAHEDPDFIRRFESSGRLIRVQKEGSVEVQLTRIPAIEN